MNISKHYIISLIIITCSLNSYAQKNNVQNAFRAFEKENIEEALKYIELAASNSSTSNDVKMHNYRGKIYYEIYSNDAFKSLDDKAILKCAQSWIAVYNHPKAKKWFEKDELTNNITKAGVGLFNKGIEFYNSKNYSSSKEMFDKVFDMIPLSKENLERSNVTQESVWLNLFYVSYAEKNNTEAKKNLQKLIDNNYQDPQIFSYMSNILIEEGNNEKALEVIRNGREYFDTDVNLIISELNYYLSSEDFVQAEELLKLAVEEDPNNHQLFFALGSSYDKLGDFDKAQSSYKEAVDIKPDFFDAHFNLAANYFNKYKELFDKAQEVDLRNKALYNAKINEANEYLVLAKPHIDYCFDEQPNDENIKYIKDKVNYILD